MGAGEDLQQDGRPPKRWARYAKRLGLVVLAVALLGAALRVTHAVSRVLGGSRSSLGVTGRLAGGRATVRHAQRFTLEYRDDCKILRVNQPWKGTKQGFVYQLIPRGSHPVPIPGAIQVEVPVHRVLVIAPAHLPAFISLGCAEAVVGVAGARNFSTAFFRDRLASGQVLDVADSVVGLQKNLNFDRIFTLGPDLVITAGRGDPALDSHDKLAEAGLKVALCADSMENTPLGRAEWIKFIAAFMDRDASAEAHFAALEQRYGANKALAARAAHRPTVLCGLDSRGAWQAPGGASYVAELVRDAGAEYLLGEDRRTGYRPIKIEAVLDKARNADFWMLHMGGTHLGSLRELAGTDSRYALFRPFRERKVFSTNVNLNRPVNNDYWEGGAANPDLVLADLIHIFHPELLPTHQLRWHAWLPPEEAR